MEGLESRNSLILNVYIAAEDHKSPLITAYYSLIAPGTSHSFSANSLARHPSVDDQLSSIKVVEQWSRCKPSLPRTGPLLFPAKNAVPLEPRSDDGQAIRRLLATGIVYLGLKVSAYL